MKKILLISPQPFFQWRGSPIRVSFNVQALSELGYSVDLLTLPIGERREFSRVEVIRVANPFKLKQIPIGPSLHKIIFDILLLFKGLQLIRKNKYIVIHGIEDAGIIAVLLGGLSRSKVIFEKHSDPSSHKKGVLKNIILAIYAFVERLTVKAASAVICTGPGLVEQVDKMGTRTKAFHIFDIPSSLVEPDRDEVEVVRTRLQKQADELLVAFVGSFAIYQGIDLLMEAIPEVIRTCPNVRFIIIGGSDEEIKQRQNILEQQGVLMAVSFLGMIAPDTLPAYLSAADILVSPRISGVNTPLKLLDYLKAGKAIVATDLEANRLILNNEVAEFAYPQPANMAAAIVSLVEDQAKRVSMGRKGYKLYKDIYNFNNYTQKIGFCYEFVQKGTT